MKNRNRENLGLSTKNKKTSKNHSLFQGFLPSSSAKDSENIGLYNVGVKLVSQEAQTPKENQCFRITLIGKLGKNVVKHNVFRVLG